MDFVFINLGPSIEGIPVIIRFKTTYLLNINHSLFDSIEGIPVIIRFKTTCVRIIRCFDVKY